MGFTFKQFHTTQERSAMKVGTDGVLLGAWAVGGHKILDIGTGTGLIALMMAQRFPNAHIDAIEIDQEAYLDANENFFHSPFSSRISLFHSSLQTFHNHQIYDSIVCNPPFFVNSLKSPSLKRSLARHTDALPYNELMRYASAMLDRQGILSLIIPLEAKKNVESEAVHNQLYLSQVIYVRTKANKPIKRCLLSFSKERVSEFITKENCLMTDDNERTEWYHQLTKDFYIK